MDSNSFELGLGGDLLARLGPHCEFGLHLFREAGKRIQLTTAVQRGVGKFSHIGDVFTALYVALDGSLGFAGLLGDIPGVAVVRVANLAT
jgi:hypothetical protein